MPKNASGKPKPKPMPKPTGSPQAEAEIDNQEARLYLREVTSAQSVRPASPDIAVPRWEPGSCLPPSLAPSPQRPS